MLHGLALAVERIVDHPRGPFDIGRVEAALHGRADGSRTQLLRGTLGQAGDRALREHGGCGVGSEVTGTNCEVELRWLQCDSSRLGPYYVSGIMSFVFGSREAMGIYHGEEEALTKKVDGTRAGLLRGCAALNALAVSHGLSHHHLERYVCTGAIWHRH